MNQIESSRVDSTGTHVVEESAFSFFRSPLRVLMVVLAFAIAGMGLWNASMKEAERNGPIGESRVLEVPASYGTAPTFELLERSGRKFSTVELKGRVWVADFIFTRCSGPCPIMTDRMVELQKAVADVADARLVTISVDPEHDTPEILAAYADAHGADPNRWFFLTGTLDDVSKVQMEGFRLGNIRDVTQHSDRFVLVDRKGSIRAYVDMNETGAVERLAAQMRDLAGE